MLKKFSNDLENEKKNTLMLAKMCCHGCISLCHHLQQHFTVYFATCSCKKSGCLSASGAEIGAK